MTKHWIKLDYARVLCARQLLASRGNRGEYVRKYVEAAEIILAGQVEESPAVEGMEGKSISFPDFLSGKPTVLLGFMADFIELNHEVDIAHSIGNQVFEALAEGSLPQTADELEVLTKSPY